MCIDTKFRIRMRKFIIRKIFAKSLEIILNFIQFCVILHNYMNIYTSIQMYMQLYKISHFAFACEILV